MTQPTASRAPMAGGFLLALSTIVGALAGAARGEPSIGFVAGLGVGVLLAVLVWVIDKLRAR